MPNNQKRGFLFLLAQAAACAVVTLCFWFCFGAHASTGYTLTIQTNGLGRVNITPDLPSYGRGSVVTLTAIAPEGWAFSHWSGNVTSNSYFVVMTRNREITAYFVPIYRLTTSVVGSGRITNNPAGSAIPSNSIVTLTAIPAYGWSFIGWNSNLNSTNNPVSISITNHTEVTALFGQRPVLEQRLQNVKSQPGERVVFEAKALGEPPLKYYWKLNNNLLPAEKGSKLVITNAQETDAGLYTLTVSNRYGASSSIATLALDEPCDNPLTIKTNSQAALRLAIAAGGHIRLCFEGTVHLRQPLFIQKDVVLDGEAGNIVIEGTNGSTLFQVLPGANFRAQKITFRNGFAMGVGGGAIYNQRGNVQVDNCTFSSNYGTLGAAILNSVGELRVFSSLFNKSKAVSGGAIANEGGEVHLEGSRFLTNSANLNGGVIYSTGNTKIERCVFIRNEATTAGGAIWTSGEMLLADTTISENVLRGYNASYGDRTAMRTAMGGALANSGRCWIDRSAILSNSVVGGLNLTLPNSTISPQPADGLGGGLYNNGFMAVSNSTLAFNKAQAGAAQGSGNYGYGLGGGIFNAPGATFHGVHLTLVGNSVAPYGPTSSRDRRGGANVANTNGLLTLRSSIMGGVWTNSNVFGKITDLGFNFSTDASAGFDGPYSFNLTSPDLEPLTDNGGPTLTMALAPNSLGIDFGPLLTTPTLDQRGFLRAVGTVADSGAYEWNAILPIVVSINPAAGRELDIEFAASEPNKTYRLQAATNQFMWEDVQIFQPQVAGQVFSKNVKATGSFQFFRVIRDP